MVCRTVEKIVIFNSISLHMFYIKLVLHVPLYENNFFKDIIYLQK